MEYESSPEKASCEDQFAYLKGLLSYSGKVKYEDNVMDQLLTHYFKRWLVQFILTACLNGSIKVKKGFTWLNDEKWIELTEIKHMVAKINEALDNDTQNTFASKVALPLKQIVKKNKKNNKVKAKSQKCKESIALKDANLHKNDGE
jgi:hypothetical protein